MFYETRKNVKKAFKVFSCFIYTIIRKYVCIDYLACELKKIRQTTCWYWRGLNIRTKVMTKKWGLEFQIC